MPTFTARRRKSTWTSKRGGKSVTVRAKKKVWQVHARKPTRQQLRLKLPRVAVHKIEIYPEGKIWHVVATDGIGVKVKGAFDMDLKEVAKIATEWQKRHKFKGQEVPITFPKFKKKR